MACWLLKTEPAQYAWSDLLRKGTTEWAGVRNRAAAAHLRAMAVGDRVLIYHSGAEKAAVGTAEVVRAAQPDGPAPWVSVAIRAAAPLSRPVTLAMMRVTAALADMAMLRQPRLSVSPVRPAEWDALLAPA